MNIENLTIGQAKEIAIIFGSMQTKNQSMLKNYIGKYVICRTRNEGINAGYVKDIDETGVILCKARRIWYHKPKDIKTAWYEGVAKSGLHKDSKISVEVEEKVIVEDYSLTICTEDSINSILNHPSHEQN